MIAIDRKWLIAGLIAASIQTATIGLMVWDRIQLLKSGREIVLPIVPVDPRSLFRGDYVILSYDVQRVPTELVTPELEKAQPSSFYVTLTKKGEVWTPTAVTLKPAAVGADQVALKARLRYGTWMGAGARRLSVVEVPQVEPNQPTPVPRRVQTFDVRYGIESYFVQEDTGGAVEKVARERKLAAVIAVDAKGNAAIKALMIDGKVQYEEPLI
jgi:uncharacterized membrane-anchored protein